MRRGADRRALHGYAIVRWAAELSDGTVRLSTGTLYALLDRAIHAGLVVAGDCAGD
jgi:PadR family transcriptional regulator, regulatory protein PadR